MGNTIFLTACVMAASVPLLPSPPPAPAQYEFPGWPESFENRPITRLGLEAREQRFMSDYPGRMARFTDGEREIVLRFVAEQTRKLHPSSDCFKAIGYGIEPQPLWIDGAGIRWGCFKAVRGDEKLWVYERIHDDRGNSWPDVSAWYWAVVLNRASGPWWAVTVAQKQRR